MPTTANPLLPATADIGWSIFVLAVVVLLVVSLISVGRRSSGLGALATAIWVVVVILLPVLGPLAWFVAGRRSVPRERRRSV